MSSRINEMIHEIISTKAANDPLMKRIIMTKLILQGIYPGRYSDEADDDPLVLAKLERLVKELGRDRDRLAAASTVEGIREGNTE